MFDGHGSEDQENQGNRGDQERWEQIRDRAQEAVRRASGQERGRGFGLLNNKPLLIGGGVVVLVAICLVLYLVLSAPSPQTANKGTTTQQAASGSAGSAVPPGAGTAARPAVTYPAQSSPNNNDVARSMAGAQTSDVQTEKMPARLARIGLSLALAALLGAVLAFRPRREGSPIRTQEAAQTQVLIGLLAAGLMLVAAGDVIVALTIVGAAIFIRVRTSALDSREGAVILVSAGTGLACGAGRWEVAILLGIFAFAVLWILESVRQDEESSRSVDLSIETRSVKETNEVLREVFDKNHIAGEFVRVDSSDPTGRTGIVHYAINVKPGTTLDRISDEIFSHDPDNVLSVNWQQRRWPSVAYR
jgi:hypothetical protein